VKPVQRPNGLRFSGRPVTAPLWGRMRFNAIIVTVVALAIYLGIWIWLKLPH
jgi:hypothetical protein